MEFEECPHIRRKLVGDETYDLCELNSRHCLIEYGSYKCDIWEEIKDGQKKETD